MNYIAEYWRAIESGGVIVSERVKKQYKKLAERTGKTDGKYIFDEKRADRPIEFIETLCKQSKGEWAGKKVELELFQKAFISALFGFVDRETKLRQYREREMQGNTFRRPSRYGLLLDPGVEAPFIREGRRTES